MKTYAPGRWWIWLFILFLSAASPVRAGVATARLYCLSLRFSSGADQNNQYSLRFTTLNYGINGEVVPDFGGTYSHFSYLELTDNWYDVTDQGNLEINAPNGDANGDGFPDVLDVSQSVSASSAGLYDLGMLGNGSIQATWSRTAGEHTGSCTLRFKPSPVYTWITITCSFEVLEFTGTLTYSNANGKISTALALHQTDFPEFSLAGSLDLSRVSSDRFNELDFARSDWTNVYEQTLTLTEGSLYRDSDWPTNYFGYIDFLDGEPNTLDPDFLTWVLSIDDLNDANHNGIPDLSDDAAVAPPRRPDFGVQRVGTLLEFTIRGDAGHRHLLQESPVVNGTAWNTIETLDLVTDPQTVSVPIPTTNRFWRVVAQ